MRRSLYICLVTATLIGSTLHAHAAPKLEVDVNRTQVYLGESVQLTIKVSNAKEVARPNLASVKNADCELLDERRQDYERIVHTNRGFEKTSFHGKIFVYRVTPTQIGAVRIGPISVQAGGRRLSAPGPDLSVQGIEQQDVVILSVDPSRQALLVDEPFQITLTIMIKNPDPGDPAQSPLDPAEPPALSVEYLNGKEIAGLSTPDVPAVLQSLLASARSSRGFTINEYSVRRDPFDMNSVFDFDSFAERQSARFTLPQTTELVRNRPYTRYRLDLTYTPEDEGSYTFGPAVFKGNIITGRGPRGTPTKRRIFAVGPACTVRVVPPPEQGRPESYIGVLGTNLHVATSLDTQTCNMGDPLTLTLTISGDGRLSNMTSPVGVIEKALTGLFRTYSETIQVVNTDHAKLYSLTVRPTTGGTIEVPSIPVSYYDTNGRHYRTVHSAPIPLRVRDITQIGENIVIDAASSADSSGSAHRNDAALPPAPLDLDPTGADRAPIHLASWQWVFLLVGPLLLIVTLVIKRASGWLRERLSVLRRRNVYSKALHAFNRAANAAADDQQSHLDAWVAAKHYFADRLRLDETGLTPEDIRRQLPRMDVPPESITKLFSLLSDCFNAGFAAASSSHTYDPEAFNSAVVILREINAALRPRRKRRRRMTLFLIPALLCLGIATQADQLTERWFLWDAANSHMSHAGTFEDFEKAAKLYETLAESGARNGPLFYNLGTAYLLAGRYAEAEKAFLRAERHMGTTPFIKRNLLLSLRGKEDDRAIGLPWHRMFLGWHYRLSVSSRITIGLAALFICWLALALRAVGLPRSGTPLLRIGLILLVVFASSVAASLHQEMRADDEWFSNTDKTNQPSGFPAATDSNAGLQTGGVQ